MRPALVIAGLAGVGLVAWMARRQVTQAEAPEEVAQDASPWNLDNLTEEATNMLPTEQPPEDQAARNLAAFLMTIREAEGTAGPNGYRTMFGHRLFSGFADHPRQPMQFTDGAGRRLWSSAAGAYQFMAISPIPGGGTTRVDTWDRLQRKLGLMDFSPESQDRAAVELIDEAGALADAKAGRFEAAVSKVRRTWASLPGAGYAQAERSLAWLAAKFTNAGGTLA
jgi:muramidase (phage lysozyme)